MTIGTIQISRFEHGGRVINLERPVTVFVDHWESGLWVYKCRELELWGFADQQDVALRSLHGAFIDAYEYLAEDDPANLDGVAQKLRKQLLELVEGGVE